MATLSEFPADEQDATTVVELEKQAWMLSAELYRTGEWSIQWGPITTVATTVTR